MSNLGKIYDIIAPGSPGRKCSSCKTFKSWDDYYPEPRNRTGFRSQCKVCVLTNRNQRNNGLKYKYGISISEKESMVSAQGGRCSLCNRIPESQLCVDHSHSTGVIRGLLCYACNTALGKLQDNPALLRLAAMYVETNGMVNGLSSPGDSAPALDSD